MLPKIMKFFPWRINIIYDLFAGGCDVCTNIKVNQIFANDINFFVIDIYKTFQKFTINDLIVKIDKIIHQWQLSMTNETGYLAFREHYNSIPIEQKNPIELYVLVCYSFNYQFRFNNSRRFNNPFGRDRSSFNPKMRENLIIFHEKLTI